MRNEHLIAEFAKNLILGYVNAQDIRNVLKTDEKIIEWSEAFPYYYSSVFKQFKSLDKCYTDAIEKAEYNSKALSYHENPTTSLTPAQEFMQKAVLGDDSYDCTTSRFSRNSAKIISEHMTYYYSTYNKKIISRSHLGFGENNKSLNFPIIGSLDGYLNSPKKPVFFVDKNIKSKTYEIY
jgi:hypothetical protein